MAKKTNTEKDILRDLEDGLILRRATVSDASALVAYNSDILRDPDEKEPNAFGSFPPR